MEKKNVVRLSQYEKRIRKGENDRLKDQFIFVTKKYEEMLKKLMGEKDFMKFSTDVAKEMFLNECKEMPEGEFKQFCLDNYTNIVEGE